MLEWKIWFWNGKELVTVTNLQASLEELPILPVVIIANIRRDHNGYRRWFERGQNFYTHMSNGEWWGASYSGLLNYIDFHRGSNFAVLRGGMVANDIYEEAYSLAKTDPEILEASQFHLQRDRNESIA